LSACWQFSGELSDALKIEKAIKQCTKQQKISLIKSKFDLDLLLRKIEIDSINIVKFEFENISIIDIA